MEKEAFDLNMEVRLFGGEMRCFVLFCCFEGFVVWE